MKAAHRPAARLLVPACALALFLTACGDRAGGSQAPPGGAAPTPVGDVDPHDPVAVEQALSSFGYPAPELLPEDLEVDRAAPPAVSLIYPRGEVRKAGLRTYRIDVNLAQFDGEAVLRFAAGGKTLDEQAFVPARSVRAPLPAAVLERLGAGDKVTWGLSMKGAKKREHLASFEVVADKPGLEKKLTRIDADAHFKASPLLRDLERARVLGDYQFDTEVVEILTQVAEKDPEIVSVHADILRSLRRLRLQETPLFREEQKRVVGVRGVGRPGAGDPVDTGRAPGIVGGPAPYRQPADAGAAMGTGGGVPVKPPAVAVAPTPEDAPPAPPPTPSGPVLAPGAFRARLEGVALKLRGVADERVLLASKAGEAARDADRDAEEAARAAALAAQAAAQAKRAAEVLPPGSPPRETAEQTAARALELAEKARQDAEAKREVAEARKKAAELAARLAADARRLAGHTPDPGALPHVTAPPGLGAADVEKLRKLAIESAQQAEAARGAVRTAQVGAEAARAALDAAAGDPQKAAVATRDLDRRLRELEDAKAEAERLGRVAKEASDLASSPEDPPR